MRVGAWMRSGSEGEGVDGNGEVVGEDWCTVRL